MNNLYNSIYEISSRLLVVLLSQSKLTLQKAACLDYMTIYAHDFDKTLISIHPDNINRNADLPSMMPIYSNSVNYLAIKGLVEMCITSQGITYTPKQSVGEIVNLFSCEYLVHYQKNLKKIIELYGSYKEKQLIVLINKTYGRI